MTEFVSDVKTIPHDDVDVYRALSDLSNLEKVKERIPQDKIKDFTCEPDACSFRIDPVGMVKFVVVEREPSKLIKFKSENLPFDVFLWVQLVSKGDRDTKMRMTVKADINPFMKPMISKPLKDALDKISDALAMLPYDTI